MPARSDRSPFSLSGRRCLVTGGTQGVGAAIAVAIAAAGGDVLVLGHRRDDAADQVVRRCRDLGVMADALVVDLAREPGDYLDDLMRQIDATLPAIDCLVNNAGTCVDTPFLQMDFDRYLRTMHLNVTAGYFLTQRFARRWVAEGIAGRVVFTGSINGLLAENDHTAYDASKGAVASLVRSLCASLAQHGIRVNSMAPGLVRTPLTAPAIDDPRIGDWMRLHTPNAQVPPPDVCGDTVVFLLSDAAAHVHGQTIYVDGGMSAWQQPDPPL